MSVGWLPSWDVTAPQSPPVTASEKLCLSILAKAGQRVDSQVAKGLAFWTCDTLFFLDAALDRATVLNPAGLSAAVDALGTTYAGVGTFGTRYGPGRHDGPTACGCCGTPPRAPAFATRAATGPPTERRRRHLTLSGRP